MKVLMMSKVNDNYNQRNLKINGHCGGDIQYKLIVTEENYPLITKLINVILFPFISSFRHQLPSSLLNSNLWNKTPPCGRIYYSLETWEFVQVCELDLLCPEIESKSIVLRLQRSSFFAVNNRLCHKGLFTRCDCDFDLDLFIGNQ